MRPRHRPARDDQYGDRRYDDPRPHATPQPGLEQLLELHVYDALRAGAGGFLLKDVPAERLFEAARETDVL